MNESQLQNEGWLWWVKNGGLIIPYQYYEVNYPHNFYYFGDIEIFELAHITNYEGNEETTYTLIKGIVRFTKNANAIVQSFAPFRQKLSDYQIAEYDRFKNLQIPFKFEEHEVSWTQKEKWNRKRSVNQFGISEPDTSSWKK